MVQELSIGGFSQWVDLAVGELSVGGTLWCENYQWANLVGQEISVGGFSQWADLVVRELWANLVV